MGQASEWDLKMKLAEAELAAKKAAWEQEKLLSTRELEIAKSQLNTISQILPKVETKGLEGKLEVEKDEYIAKQVAHHAMSDIASDIAAALKQNGILPSTAEVMIVDRLDFATSDLPLLEVKRQLKTFLTLLSEQIKQNERLLELMHSQEEPESLSWSAAATSIAAVAPIALSAISTAASITSYFKTDYNITGYEFSLSKEGLIAAVAGKLCLQTKVHITNFYALDNLAVMQNFADLQQQLIKLSTLRQQIAARIHENSSSDKRNVSMANAAIQASDTLLAIIDSFSKSITDKLDNQTHSILVQAALREKIKQMNITHLLYLDVLSSGGQGIRKRSLWRSGIGYVGGAVVAYVLSNTNGNILAADTLSKLSVYDYKPSFPHDSRLTRIQF